MRILIVGAGSVGCMLAESLSSEKHDVTVVDSDQDPSAGALDNLDVMIIRGGAASFSALRSAGAGNADVVIAVTRNDEVNMLSCITSKKLGAKYSIARIRDPEYARDAELFMNQLNIDFVINPERSTAGEILRLLRIPAAVEVDTFFRGRVEIVGLRVTSDDVIIGEFLKDLRKRVKAQILFCIVERDGELFIPRGDFVILGGDLVYFAGKYADVTKLLRLMGRETGMVENAMILGGNRAAYYLSVLAAKIGIKPVIVEADEKKCERIAEDVPQATVICGDGTEPELLESENIRLMDAFVALTDSDEENLMLSLFANRCGVRKVVAMANRLDYVPLVSSLGVDSVISPHVITASHILHFVRGLSGSRGGKIISLHRLLDGRVEALEFEVGSDMPYLEVKIKEMPIRQDVMIAVISSGGNSIVPDGEAIIKKGDKVVVVTTHIGFDELNDIFSRVDKPFVPEQTLPFNINYLRD